jgi:hypothetical protein
MQLGEMKVGEMCFWRNVYSVEWPTEIWFTGLIRGNGLTGKRTESTESIERFGVMVATVTLQAVANNKTPFSYAVNLTTVTFCFE